MSRMERSAIQHASMMVVEGPEKVLQARDWRSMYISPIRSPLRATVTDTRPELVAEPLTVCWMFSMAKLVWRLYTAWKKVTLGLPVR